MALPNPPKVKSRVEEKGLLICMHTEEETQTTCRAFLLFTAVICGNIEGRFRRMKGDSENREGITPLHSCTSTVFCLTVRIHCEEEKNPHSHVFPVQ